MDLQQLATFIKIAELSSFSKAAEALGYSQAAVTIQIKQLEAELDVLLFDRIGKKTSLTNEGLTLKQYAHSILQMVTDAKIALSDQTKLGGKLRIGASESLCTYILPSIISAFHTQYPQIALSLKAGNVSELSFLLSQNEVDLICLFAKETDFKMHQLLFAKPEPFAFVTSPIHPLATAKQLSLSALNGKDFLLTEPGCSYRESLEQLLLKNQITVQPLIEIGNTEAIKRYASAGLGIALLPYFTVQKECEANELITLPVSELPLSLSHQLLCHKSKHLSPILEAFITLYQKSI